MLEATIVGAIGLITGLGALTNRVHGRINDIDKRVDALELRLAEQYVSKQDLNEIVSKVEAHMIRIEAKLDRISLNQH